MITWFLRSLFSGTAEKTSSGSALGIPPFVAGILFAVFAIFLTQRGIIVSPPLPPTLHEEFEKKTTSKEGEEVIKSMGEEVREKKEEVTNSMGEEVIEKKKKTKNGSSLGLHTGSGTDSESESRHVDSEELVERRGGGVKKKEKGMTVGEWHERRAWFRYSLSTVFYVIVGGAIIYEVGRITKTTQSDFFDYFSMIFPRESEFLLRFMTRRRS